MRTITVEEHYATAAFMDGPGRQLAALADSAREHPQVAAGYELLIKQLCDLGDGRIAAMDAAGIDVQVLSLTSPGAEQLDAPEAVAFAAATNDCLAAAVRRHPSRFAGFAALPTSAPDAAADELERTVRAYGFKGALINGHSRGRYLDDEFFWPILQRAEALQVPLYLHPTPPPQSAIKEVYAGNYEPDVTSLLATTAWGWHIDTAIHVLRLVLSGAFDRFPDLQLIIGHLGEGLPFMLPRLEIIPIEQFRRQLEVNVTGQLAITQVLLPLLRRARGRIVLIGSIGTRFTPPFTGPVSASKSAIATMAEALRQELDPWDIRVILIEPASIHTEAIDKLARDAERLMSESDPSARTLYEDAFQRFVRVGLARERNGSPPQVVAQAVARALTIRRPRSRYLVGKDSRRMATLAAALPTPVLDTLRRKIGHQPAPGSRATSATTPEATVRA